MNTNCAPLVTDLFLFCYERDFMMCLSEEKKSEFIEAFYIQSTLVISNSKGLSEILRDIRSSTYQVCRIEEKII